MKRTGRRMSSAYNAPCGTDVDRRIAGLQPAPSEVDLLGLITAADDVEADDMVGEIHEQSDAAIELLDHQCPVVRVRVVAILLLELSRRHQMTPEFRRVA